MKVNDFKIICGDIKIDNNTIGGKFLLDNSKNLSKEHFKKGHIDLPLSIFKD